MTSPFLRIAPIAGAVLLAAAATVSAPLPAEAASKAARCMVVSGGATKFNGRCRFTSGRGGSFTLSRSRGALYGSIMSVSVTVLSRGGAEVRGLTRAGNNSRWGRAHRSKRDPACWIGSDFRICAW